ncbi:MAG: roadblock/LC7 domain-containing protein [Bifidobacteriaceae bacterium]|jgi:predicted regulator of Ras-like GTPase activity (Roadblock/LC7/MglB family)|nr:roadblock/LC7 domain-containing protein [Bifidobacteriaceae bacterium]
MTTNYQHGENRQDLTWLLDSFVRSTPGARLGVVVSADGLLMTMSGGADRTVGDIMAAICSGMSSLARGAGRELGIGRDRQSVIEYEEGFVMLMSISNGSILAVLCEPDSDVGLVGYEMATLVGRAETFLTPALIAQMRDSLPTTGTVRGGM